MGRSRHPSIVTMPPVAGPPPSILDFLCCRFPRVPRESWERRIAEGGVLDERGEPVTPATPCAPGRRLFYFRESAEEPAIPGEEAILHQDDHLLVADKPHFLPVNPAGPFVTECLLDRLRRRTGLAALAPLHRIDRETAGLVLFSVDPRTRGRYADLFRSGGVEKGYLALSAARPGAGEREWRVEDRLEPGEPWFRMRRVPGPVNARSLIWLDEAGEKGARFRLRPLTGKKHQLRVHMASLGFPIRNDRWYPELAPESADDLSAPLALLARSVRFRDPLTGATRDFVSPRSLSS